MQDKKQNSQNKHVIVIGGGLSGLSAAEKIAQSNPKIQITVLEAKDRLGGRTYSGKLQNAMFDFGGMYVGPHQKYVINLLKRAKMDLVAQPTKGLKTLELNGKAGTYKTDIPTNVNIFALLQMQYYMWRINKWAKGIPKDFAPQGKDAIYWDSMTISSWLQQNIYFTKVKKLFEVMVRIVFGCEPNEMSMLQFLQYVHQHETLEKLCEVKDGNQEKKIVQGAQNMSHFLAEQIKQLNPLNQILLNQPVISIDQRENQVFVKTKSQETFQADYAIIAMPPQTLQWIDFSPKLSDEKDFLSSRTFNGVIIKSLVLFKTAFWKEKGFCAEVVSDCVDSPVQSVFDDTKIKDNGEEQPALLIFSAGAVGRHWADRPDFKDKTLQKLKQLFKSDEALHPIEFHIEDWTKDKYIRGGPVGVYTPGTLSQMTHKLYHPEGRVHFAGTEYASEGPGYMDGAIQSGLRAADEILELVGGKKPQGTKQETHYSKYVNKRQGKFPGFAKKILQGQVLLFVAFIIYYFVK